MGLLGYLLRALAGEYEMKMALGFASIAITILLTVGMSLAVSFAVAKKNKKIDMVDSAHHSVNFKSCFNHFVSSFPDVPRPKPTRLI